MLKQSTNIKLDASIYCHSYSRRKLQPKLKMLQGLITPALRNFTMTREKSMREGNFKYGRKIGGVDILSHNGRKA